MAEYNLLSRQHILCRTYRLIMYLSYYYALVRHIHGHYCYILFPEVACDNTVGSGSNCVHFYGNRIS